MKQKIQLVDTDYQIEDGEVTVRCFGKSENGESVLYYDRKFLPYVYVVPKEDADIGELKDLIEQEDFEEEGEPLPVREVEKLELEDLKDEKQVLKVYSSIPAKIPKLKNKFWDLEEVEECREFDIPFYRRYLIDKGIRPASWIEVEGKEVENDDFDKVIEADQIFILEEKPMEKDSPDETEEPGSFEWNTVAFDLEVYEEQVIMASFYGKDFRKVLTTEEIDRDFVETVKSEKELIERFVEIVEKEDIDILTGYNTDEFDFDVLRERSNEHNITLALGLDGERMKFNRRGRFKGARLKGRMHLDLYPFISHVIAPGLESETLDLDSVAEELLGLRKDDLSWEEMKTSWKEKKDLEEFADYSLKDSELAFKLAEELVPQMLELSRITGLIPFDACRLTYGQLTENYLLREAHERDMMALNRPSQDKRQKRQRQGAYSGGFVYTPDAGLYENLALFDFKSLYPTVMVAHNISPDTLNIEECEDMFELEEFDYNFCQDEKGFFPELVEELVKDRSEIKNQMKKAEEGSQELQILDNRQQAEKVLANSVGPKTTLVLKDPEDTLRILDIERFYSLIQSEEIQQSDSEYKEIEGWKALSVKGDRAVYKPVYAASKHIPDSTYNVRTGMGAVLVTGDHSLMEMQGKANSRIRDSSFECLEPLKCSDLSKNHILAQVNDLDLPENSNPQIIVPKLLDGEQDFCLYIPKSKNFDKKNWYENRVKIIDAINSGKTSSEQIQEETGLGRKIIQKSRKDNWIKKTQIVGNYGNVYECEVTEKGAKYREFYEDFTKCHKTSKYYVLPIDDLSKTPPENIVQDSFVANRSGRARNKIPAIIEIDEDLASILGWYVAEGHVRSDSTKNGSCFEMAITSNDKEVREEVKELFDEVFNYDASINGNQVCCSTSTICKVFSNLCGKSAFEKKAPTEIINSNSEARNSFLESYTNGDGDSDGKRLSTVSERLKAGISLLLKEEDCVLHNGFDTDTYRISRRSKTQGEKIVSGDLYGQKPKSIDEVDTPEFVYDISVEDTENFVTAEGLVLHNSFYGYLGYNSARWYSRESAEAITYLGRKHIQETIEKAEEEGYEVVYGDSLDYSRQIVVKDPKNNIKFVEIGDFVENTPNPQDHETIAWKEDTEKAVFKPIRRAIAHNYEENLLQFDTNRGRTKVTPQHSVYMYENGNIELADAQKLEKGDYIVSLSEPPCIDANYSEGDLIDLTELEYQTSKLRAYLDTEEFPAEMAECPYCGNEYYLSSHINSQHPERKVTLEGATSEYCYIGCKNAKAGKIPRFIELSSDFAWVLGFYCGDGSASTGDKQMISFGAQDRENIQKIKDFFDNILEEELKIIENIDSRTGSKMYYYRVQRKPLVSLFVDGLDAGKGSSGKKVPNVILNGDTELMESFIEGYFEADGSRDKENDSRYNSENMSFSTKSSYLANQVQYILKQLELGENGYERKINDVSYKYRDDKPQIKSIRNTAPQKPEFAESNFTPARINKVEKVSPTKDKVYDLEVEGEHNFVDAEGLILVHNTDSVFLKKDNIKEEMDEFLDEVNQQLPEFMQLEFEGFFTRGFFTSTASGEGAKKKYALLSEDGSMKITGFEQVRRDWSPIAKKTQKKVLRKVLEDKVTEAADIVKETIQKLKDREIPLEDLKIYTTLTKPPEEYGSTAPHVEAVKKAKERGDEIAPETTVAYVIGRGGGTISSRAELLKYANDYDSDYYVDNQVIPATLRVLKVFGYTEGQLKGKGKQSGLGKFGG